MYIEHATTLQANNTCVRYEVKACLAVNDWYTNVWLLPWG